MPCSSEHDFESAAGEPMPVNARFVVWRGAHSQLRPGELWPIRHRRQRTRRSSVDHDPAVARGAIRARFRRRPIRHRAPRRAGHRDLAGITCNQARTDRRTLRRLSWPGTTRTARSVRTAPTDDGDQPDNALRRRRRGNRRNHTPSAVYRATAGGRFAHAHDRHRRRRSRPPITPPPRSQRTSWSPWRTRPRSCCGQPEPIGRFWCR